MLPYAKLPELESGKDRNTIRHYPDFAARAGYRIVPIGCRRATTPYCGPARIEAGWPGNLMRCPVSVSVAPSTLRTDMSPSMKFPT